MFFAGSGRQRRARLVRRRPLVVLHEHEVPVLQEALVVAARQVLCRAVARRRGRGTAPSTARTARSARPARSSPSAGIARSARAIRRPRCQQLDRLLVGAEPQPLVALEHGHPDVPLGEAEHLPRELPRELDRLALEVVAEREVPEHLEERQVPGRCCRRCRCRPSGSTSDSSSAAAPAAVSWPRKYGFSGCMPATVKSAEGSCAEGTSEAEATRACPRSSKKAQVALADLVGAHHRASDLRPIARVESEDTGATRSVPWPTITRPRTGTRTAREPCARRARSAPRSRARGAPRATSPASRHASRRPRERTFTPSTQPPSRCSVTSRTRDAVAQQQLARPDRDRARARVGREHVQRLATADMPRPWRCPTVNVARRRARRAPSPRIDAPRALPEAAVALQEGAVARAREEAHPASRACARPPGRPPLGQLAHLRLRHLSQRKPQPRERLGRERRAAHSSGPCPGRSRCATAACGLRPRWHPRVVAGRERPRPQPLGQLEHRVEPHVPVAAHARVRRHAGRVLGQPRLDDPGAELGAQIDRQVRHAQAVRHLARAAHRLRRAAARLAVVLRIGPQLQRHRRPPSRPRARRAAPRPRCRRRRSSPRACGRRRREFRVERTPRPSARCSASAASSARVALGRDRPPSSRAISSAPIFAASSSGGPLISDTTALPAASVTPQPCASNPAAAIRPPASRAPARCASDRRTERPGGAGGDRR